MKLKTANWKLRQACFQLLFSVFIALQSAAPCSRKLRICWRSSGGSTKEKKSSNASPSVSAWFSFLTAPKQGAIYFGAWQFQLGFHSIFLLCNNAAIRNRNADSAACCRSPKKKEWKQPSFKCRQRFDWFEVEVSLLSSLFLSSTFFLLLFDWMSSIKPAVRKKLKEREEENKRKLQSSVRLLVFKPAKQSNQTLFSQLRINRHQSLQQPINLFAQFA